MLAEVKLRNALNIKNKTKEFKQETHSVHWGINPLYKHCSPPSFLPSPPPLNQQTVQASPFLENPPPLYIGFS